MRSSAEGASFDRHQSARDYARGAGLCFTSRSRPGPYGLYADAINSARCLFGTATYEKDGRLNQPSAESPDRKDLVYFRMPCRPLAPRIPKIAKPIAITAVPGD